MIPQPKKERNLSQKINTGTYGVMIDRNGKIQ